MKPRIWLMSLGSSLVVSVCGLAQRTGRVQTKRSAGGPKLALLRAGCGRSPPDEHLVSRLSRRRPNAHLDRLVNVTARGDAFTQARNVHEWDIR